ncbi:hypothetical protein EIP86_004173 [Pleurotus ostreatoroseus]|nr:hypothetical protein EIP86_004173 [Pleurotus ostreatoroseus]
MASLSEPKDGFSSPSFEPSSSATSSTYAIPGLTPLSDLYHRFSAWRKNLDLPAPGTVENLTKEVKNTHLTNFFFDGARADLTKGLSANPAFQVTHSFALGSQTVAPSYNFGAVYLTDNVFLQGGMDHEGSLNARFNQGWGRGHVSKFQGSFSSTPGHSMLQIEHDYQGRDYSVNLKAMNPSPVDLTGMYIGNILQSVTKHLALGVEGLYQRPQPDLSDLALSYLVKYTGGENPSLPWIGTAQLSPTQGLLQTTYWQKLSEKLEVAADLQLIANSQRRDAIATLGARWDLRMATFRAQLDSTGKVSALLEQRFAPSFSFLVAGEIDHFRNAAKVGVGVMIESSSLTPEEMSMAAMPHPPQ